MSDINLKVRPIDQDAPGFLPRYRQLLAAKRALADFKDAQPEDVDEAIKLILEHVTEPEAPAAKLAAIEKLTSAQLMEVLGAILGEKIVPPASGAA